MTCPNTSHVLYLSYIVTLTMALCFVQRLCCVIVNKWPVLFFMKESSFFCNCIKVDSPAKNYIYLHGYFVESNLIFGHESLFLVKERWEILTLIFRNGLSIKFAFCTHFSITGVLNESKTFKHNCHIFLKALIKYSSTW